MRIAKRLIDASGGRLAPAGQTTQFVVGAAGEPDHEILGTTAAPLPRPGPAARLL